MKYGILFPGPQVATQRQAWAASAFIVVAAIFFSAALVWTASGGPAFRLDDAYIVLNNVAAITQGDASFADVAPLHGSTSLLHSLAVFVLSRVLAPEVALFCLAWSAVLAQALAALHLAWDMKQPVWFGLALAALTATAGDLIRVQVNGLETGWMVAAILWALALAARNPAGPALAILAACLPFIRPELAILTALLAIYALKHLLRNGDTRAVLWLGALFVAVTGALCAAQYAYSGSPLPITGSAKRYFFETMTIPANVRIAFGAETVLDFLLKTGGPMMLAVVFVRTPLSRLALVFAGLTTLALSLAYPAIISQNWNRYLYFLLPVAIFSLATLRGSGRPRAARLAVVILAAGLIFNIAGLATRIEDRIRTTADKRDTLAQTAAWINRNLDPDAPLLLHDVGYLSWATSQRMFDIVGLRTPAAVEINRAMRYQKGERGQADALEAMIAASGACVMLVSTGWNRWLDFSGLLRARGWTVTPHPAGDPPGHEAYVLSGGPQQACAAS